MLDRSSDYSVLRVLLVEDDDDDYLLTESMLEQSPLLRFDLSRVADYDAAIAAAKKVAYDVFLVDYRLGKKDGLDLVRDLADAGCEAPIILLTGLDDQNVDIEAMEAGATDYLIKGDITAPLLERSIRYAMMQRAHLDAERQSRDLLEQANRRLADLYETAHGFVDNVSHEFRTPLTVIKEYAALMRDGLGGEVSAQQCEFLAIILDRVDDLRFLVDDMLDVSRIEAGLLGVTRREFAIADIVERIRPVLERKAQSSNIELCIDIDNRLPAAYGDAEKIGRVLINLVVNACKFAGAAADNDADTAPTRVVIAARYQPATADIAVTVQDFGPGIPTDQLQVIFERFRQSGGPTRTASKGFGLGLNIAKELVQLNYGDIGVESSVGAGSRFTFTVPVNDPAAIVARYIDARTETIAATGAGGGLALYEVSATGSDEGLSSVDEGLHRRLRRQDLLIRLAAGRWVICIGDGGEPPESTADANRDKPAVTVQRYGQWQLPSQKDDVVAAFADLLLPRPHEARLVNGQAVRTFGATLVEAPAGTRENAWLH